MATRRRSGSCACSHDPVLPFLLFTFRSFLHRIIPSCAAAFAIVVVVVVVVTPLSCCPGHAGQRQPASIASEDQAHIHNSTHRFFEPQLSYFVQPGMSQICMRGLFVLVRSIEFAVPGHLEARELVAAGVFGLPREWPIFLPCKHSLHAFLFCFSPLDCSCLSGSSPRTAEDRHGQPGRSVL